MARMSSAGRARCATVARTRANPGQGSGRTVRRARRSAVSGSSSRHENFTPNASPQTTARVIISPACRRCPSRHVRSAAATKTSAVATSFFTSAACARKFGLSTYSAVAISAARGPPRPPAQSAMSAPRETPRTSIMARLRFTTAAPSTPGAQRVPAANRASSAGASTSPRH